MGYFGAKVWPEVVTAQRFYDLENMPRSEWPARNGVYDGNDAIERREIDSMGPAHWADLSNEW